MNLLPQSHTEFLSPEYWDRFFKKRGANTFEWYGEYPQLCSVLHRCMKPQDKILVVGCGNSQLSENMYDVGYTSIVNIDISNIVIRQMHDRNRSKRPLMSFMKMDVTEMSFSDEEFSVVLDKGTLDALMVDSSEAVVATVDHMFEEIKRVLRPCGRYVCISLMQDHILKKVTSYFTDLGWPIRIYKLQMENTSSTEKDFQLPVFAFMATKFKKMPNMKQIFEISSCEDKVERLDNLDKLISVVKEMQYYAIIRQKISQRKISGDQPVLCLYSDVSSSPRYKLYIVDNESKCADKFAIFIAPEGRESDWIFRTETGRIELSESAGFERLVIVTLSRDHVYKDLDTIKAELSEKMMELVPPSFKEGVQVPFLSFGETFGKRIVQQEGESEISGKFVVEDVETDNHVMLRRLIFLATDNIVQSEARLVKDLKKKTGQKDCSQLVVDKCFLSCEHHIAMTSGLAFVEDFQPDSDKALSSLLIGLGGGGLAVFLHEYFPRISLDVVEIDPVIVDIATKWFGFSKDDHLKVHIGDGLDFIHKFATEGQLYDTVMFDVDSKDRTLGLSCPPASFLEMDFLKTTASIIADGGVFVLNLVCRDESLKQTILDRVHSVFSAVFVVAIQSEVNETVFAIKRTSQPNTTDKSTYITIKQAVKNMNLFIQSKTKSSEIDLLQALETLQIR